MQIGLSLDLMLKSFPSSAGIDTDFFLLPHCGGSQYRVELILATRIAKSLSSCQIWFMRPGDITQTHGSSPDFARSIAKYKAASALSDQSSSRVGRPWCCMRKYHSQSSRGSLVTYNGTIAQKLM